MVDPFRSHINFLFSDFSEEVISYWMFVSDVRVTFAANDQTVFNCQIV